MNDQITNLKIAMAEFQKDIGFLKEQANKNDNQHKEIIGKIDSFVHTANGRFLNKSDHLETIRKIDSFIEAADKRFADRDEFTFWRNILISGLVLTIAAGILISLFK
jgi:hypothetical protein